jgi:hypothetical protein
MMMQISGLVSEQEYFIMDTKTLLPLGLECIHPPIRMYSLFSRGKNIIEEN